MRRGQRQAHQRIWWVIGPLLVGAVVYATLYPAVLPVSDPPAVLSGVAP
ncbi:MAG: hypothetical protein AAGA48_31710 [Myxococcota bacterium]